MIEKLMFNIIAIALFTITFLKLVKKNDVSYIYLLVVQFIGIAINFIELFLTFPFHWSIRTIMYLLAILLPSFLYIIAKIQKADLAELLKVMAAHIYQKKGNTNKAKQILNDFLAKNKNSYKAHKLLAEIYEKEENYEAAISEYMLVTTINSKDYVSNCKLALLFNKNKQPNQAISILQEMLKQKPEYEKASNLLGDILFEQERYKDAILVYHTSLRYHPGSYELYYSLAMAYTMVNDFQMAKEFYQKAAQINTMIYNAKLNLGQIAFMSGDLEEAERYFLEACKQEDLEAGSYYYLSKIALLKGEEDKAINYMNVAVQIDIGAYKQIQIDPVFIPIRNKITLPKEEMVQNKKKQLTKKEKIVNKHLVKTSILAEGLNRDGQNTKNKSKRNQKETQEKQKE